MSVYADEARLAGGQAYPHEKRAVWPGFLSLAAPPCTLNFMSNTDPKTPTKRNTAFKIKLRGKDGAPLSMTELQQGLYDIARRLQRYPDYRTS